MDANLRNEIQEIIELVKQCPEPLQLRAFEMLLQHALKNNGAEKGERVYREEESASETPARKSSKTATGQVNQR